MKNIKLGKSSSAESILSTMHNQFIEIMVQLFALNEGKVTHSRGKKMLGIFTVMQEHHRLFFGVSGMFMSGAIYQSSPKVMDFYAIKYDGKETLCYNGIWRGGEDISWLLSRIVKGDINRQIGFEESQALEAELRRYFVSPNIVSSINENDPRAGYFIPVYEAG